MIGAGQRGMYAYAAYAETHPNEIKFIAVAEPDPDRRDLFCSSNKIPAEMAFSDYNLFFNRKIDADCVFVCTQDRNHVIPAVRALELGYHVMLEKPMATSPGECIRLRDASRQTGRHLIVAHVLRYTRFFQTIKKLISQGRIGTLVCIQHNENVGFWHMAHSFVRGNWARSDESCPMILAKSCHDMDILHWLAGAPCSLLSSTGDLHYFHKDNMPEGAAERCLDGCPHEDECPYHVKHVYLTENRSWPASVLGHDLSVEERIRALAESPYGRCVYRCENNVVDHQIVSMEFANKVKASFVMSGFTHKIDRTIKVMGSHGEIRGTMDTGEIEVYDFRNGDRERIDIEWLHNNTRQKHGGGDTGLMKELVALLSGGEGESLTDAAESVHSHLMAFAAEESRLGNRFVSMTDFERSNSSD